MPEILWFLELSCIFRRRRQNVYSFLADCCNISCALDVWYYGWRKGCMGAHCMSRSLVFSSSRKSFNNQKTCGLSLMFEFDVWCWYSRHDWWLPPDWDRLVPGVVSPPHLLCLPGAAWSRLELLNIPFTRLMLDQTGNGSAEPWHN